MDHAASDDAHLGSAPCITCPERSDLKRWTRAHSGEECAAISDSRSSSAWFRPYDDRRVNDDDND